MRETLTIGGIAVGSFCVGFILAAIRAFDQGWLACEANAKAKREARMHQLFEDIRVEKLNDRAAIDALVGPSTYEGGE